MSIVAIRASAVDFGFVRYDAEGVYFVRVDAGEPAAQAALIRSNYADGGYVYLVNAEPGSYAAVALFMDDDATSGFSSPVGGGVSVGFSKTHRYRDTTYFTAHMIEETIVDVKPSTISFMGELEVSRRGRTGGVGDEAQEHYRPLADRMPVEAGVGSSIYWIATKGTWDRSDAARQKFVDRSRRLMAASGWDPVLGAVSAAPPR